jgi:hypothetical protein
VYFVDRHIEQGRKASIAIECSTDDNPGSNPRTNLETFWTPGERVG